MLRPGLIYVDRVKPTVAMTSPAGTIAGSVTVSASASDNDKVASVQLQVDGGNLGAAVTVPPYQASYDTRALADGVHSFGAIATDRLGNTQSASVNATTANNIAFLGGGGGNGSATYPGVAAGTLVVAAVFVSGAALASITDDAGSTWNLLGGPSALSESNPYLHTGDAYYYYSFANAGSSVLSAAGSGGAQTTVVAACYSNAEGGVQSNSGLADWTTGATSGGAVPWSSGTTYAYGSTRGLAVAFIWFGYDGGPGGATAVSGFTKREQASDVSLTDFQVAVCDSITTSGGSTGTPSGNSFNNSNVYGAAVVFKST